MSSDKRRRARVQGGWASPAAKVEKDKNVRKPNPTSTAPAWLARTVDVPNTQKLIYQEPDEDIRQKPALKIIDKPGVYDISLGPTGVSRIRLFHNFLDPKESKEIYSQLFNELPWQQRIDTRKGYLQPRLTAWYGDEPYKYAGITNEANTNWPPCVRTLRQRLEENTGNNFNSVLANLYRDGHDSVDWHSDDEPTLGDMPTIASLSFGDTRMFEMRKKPPPEEQGDYTYMEHIQIPLAAGSLLIMEGATQADWQHKVPKEYHDRESRINLTYRVIYPEIGS